MRLLFREHGKIYLVSSNEFVEGDREREREREKRGRGREKRGDMETGREGDGGGKSLGMQGSSKTMQTVLYNYNYNYPLSAAGQFITKSNTISCAGGSRGQLQKFRNSI